MRLTSRNRLSFFLIGAATIALSSSALGQAMDARAEALERRAMDEDYLATDFAAAEKKLNEALKLCAKNACSSAVAARIELSLGIVFGGQGKVAEARERFIAGLTKDPTVELDEDLATAELKAAFEQARSEILDVLDIDEEVVLEEIAHSPPREQETHAPLPIFLMVPDDVDASRVQLRYRSPGAADFKTMRLAKLEIGYGSHVPCEELRSEGVFTYYIQVLDSTGAVVMTAGTMAQPFRVRIREELTGDPPHLPGQPPPALCVKKEKAKPAVDETIYPPCDSDRDCAEGMFCSSRSRCEEGVGFEDIEDESPFAQAKKSWVSVSFAADIAYASGTDVCTQDSQRNNYFACFQSSGEPYVGNPILGRANDIQGGFALATMRAMLGYDHLVHPNVTVGGRIGYAFNGSPDDFLPVHVDARVAFYFGKDSFSRAGVRPFVFASGGLMQVDTLVAVEAWELTDECQTPGGCKVELDAWRRAGNAFAALGVGAQYAVTKAQALVLSVRGAYLFPAGAAVITPEIGFATGF